MKTKEELNALKEEAEMLNKKLTELSEDELKQVTGGANIEILLGKITVELAPDDDPFDVLLSLKIQPMYQPDYESFLLLNSIAAEMKKNGYKKVELMTTLNRFEIHINEYYLS